MRSLFRKFFAGLYILHLLIYPAYGQNENTKIPQLTNVTINEDNVVIELNQIMPYDVYTLDNPQRLIIEVKETQFKGPFSRKDINSSLIRRVRAYQFKENPLITRVIVDLKYPVDYTSNTNGNEITVSLKKNENQAGQKEETKPASKSASGKKLKGLDLLQNLPREVVTLDFEGADIKDVVRLMAETSNINIIFGPEVTGNITIHLRKVPFDEAFKTILNLKGLVATQLGANIIRVSTPDILSQERSKAVMSTKTFPINYLKAADMQTHVQSIMQSSGRRGTISVVQETNSLVVTDTEEGLDQDERLIANLDKRPKQVMIEARIVEINLDNGFDIGVQWEYVKQNVKGQGDATFVGLRAESKSDARVFQNQNGVGYGAVTPGNAGTGVNLAGPTTAGITFGFIKDNSILSATLSALVTQSRAQILSAPKVVTINGQKAKIEAITQIPFKTTTVAASGQATESFTMINAGITLEVTPTINAQERITLVIHPDSSIPSADTLASEAGPRIRTRDAQTTVIVKDGDTLVIGGLIDDEESKSVQKVPLLGDIPIIGVFFRHNSTSKTRNELLVFVTPRIVRE